MTQQPLTFQVICLVSEAVKHLKNNDMTHFISDAVQQIAKDIEKSPVHSSLGLFIFQCNVNITLQQVLKKFGSVHEVAKEGNTSWHEMSLKNRRICSEPHGRVHMIETVPNRRALTPPWHKVHTTFFLNTTDKNNSQKKKNVVSVDDYPCERNVFTIVNFFFCVYFGRPFTYIRCSEITGSW